MVVISMTFDVATEAHVRFEEGWRRTFLPAVSAWPGYVECRLLRRWPMDNDRSDDNGSFRVDLVFRTEEDRLNWAHSSDHADAFSRLTALAENVIVSRYRLGTADERPT